MLAERLARADATRRRGFGSSRARSPSASSVARRRRIDAVRWQHACDLMGNLDPADTREELVRARIVIDASYEGDVTAWSGAPYRLGREARSALEPHAGRIYTNEPGGTRRTACCRIRSCREAPAQATTRSWLSRAACTAGSTRTTRHDAPHRLRAPPPGYDPTLYRLGSRRDAPRRHAGLLQHALRAGQRQVPAQPHGARQQPGRAEPRVHPCAPARAQGAAPALRRPCARLSVLHPDRRRHARARPGARRVPGQRPSALSDLRARGPAHRRRRRR